MTNKKPKGTAGYTMLEIMVSMTVLSVLMSFIFLAQSSGQKVANRATHEDETQVRLTRTVERVASELRSIIDDSTWEDLTGMTTVSEVLTFQSVASLENGVLIPSQVTRIAFVPEEGEGRDDVDNDGDGLVDEGIVTLVRNPTGADEISVTLCRNVREYFEGETLDFEDENGNGLVDEAGFHFERIGDQLLIRLTIEDVNLRGDVVTQSAESLIRIRN
ncbi:MAG: prepilin-type N-terminal cleavage/methylation domain-containing protein [Bacteroidia bacterium]|jgi:prepilin-type N-terminal cleavage/methylation domain-containing protein